ncbi:UNVERIFIED_CONTAM: hypothetical protein RMT77_004017 [Armadillidium vulgare]
MNTYTDDEVFSMIKEVFEIDISKKDLIDCKPEVIHKIYSMFLRDLGYSVEKFSQIPFSAPADIHQYPQMYKDVLFPITIAKCVRHFMNMVYDNTEFNMMDAISPEWSRSKKFLVMFIEFYQFVSINLPKYNEVDEEHEQKKQYLDELKDKIKLYKDKIRKRELENVEAEIELEKITKSLTIESEEIENLQENKNRLRGRLEGLKEEIKEVNIKVKETELVILEHKEKIELLKSQVIDETQYLEIEEGKKKLEMLKEANVQLKTTLKDLKQNLKLLNEYEDMISNVWIPALKEYETEFNKKEELTTKFEENKKEITKLMEKYKDLVSTLQVLKENVKGLEDGRSQLTQRKDLNINGLKQEIKQLQLTLEDIKKGSEEQVIVAHDLQSEFKKISKYTEELTQKYDHFLELSNTRIEELKSKFREKCQADLKKLKISRKIKKLTV